MNLTSPRNTRLKSIHALSQRRKRQETGLYFAEGIRLVGEAVQTRAEIETLVVAPELLSSDFGWDTVRQAEEYDVEILNVSADVFQSLSRKDGPQGIGVVVRQRWTALQDARPAEKLGWVILEDIQNPGNLGSILRTCDAVGAAGVILLGDTADPYDPAAVRGSMGSVFFSTCGVHFRGCVDPVETGVRRSHDRDLGRRVYRLPESRLCPARPAVPGW